jgi:hypothetical protein
MAVSSSSSSQFLVDNSASPFFLHNGDNPGTVLVSQPLTGENYNTWSRSMIVSLTAKNKLGFIDGSLPKPSPDDESLHHSWTRCNNMIIAWILNYVSKEIASSIIYITTCEEMWQDLKDRFSQGNGPRIFQLQKILTTFSQENSSVSQYFTRIKSIWDELNNYDPIPSCTCGGMRSIHEKNNRDRVFQFLMGLDDSYSHIRGQILLNDPLPPINKVFSLIVQEERQKEISASPLIHETAALMKKADAAPQKKFIKFNNRKEKPTCSHCGITGHTVDKCYRVHGFPPGFKFTKNKFSPHSANQVQELDSSECPPPKLPISLEQCQQLLAFIQHQSIAQPAGPSGVPIASAHSAANPNTQITGPFTSSIFTLNPIHSVFSSTISHHPSKHPLQKTPWIVNTGATDHMICSPSFYTKINSVGSTCVQLPNDAFASVTHIGIVQISETLILTNVLCVPSFTFNLLSASKLTKQICCCFIFLYGFCFMQSLRLGWVRSIMDCTTCCLHLS